MALSLAALGVAPKALYRGSPLIIPAPYLQSQTTATTGGTLGNAVTTGYRITAIVGAVETAVSNELTQVTGASTGTHTVTITWVPVVGATSYKVYGRTVGSELFMATVTAPTTSWTDTGSITPSGAMPGATGFSEGTLYTVPGSKVATLQKVLVSNPNANAAGQFYLSHIPSGGGGGRLFGGAIIRPDAEAGIAPPVELGLPMQAGDTVTGYVTLSGCVVTLLGAEVPA